MILDWEDVALSHPLRKKKGLRILRLEDYIIGADKEILESYDPYTYLGN